MATSDMTIDTTHMSRKQLINVGRLIVKAGELDFPLDNSMVQVGYNTTYGNTYLWCEDIPYTIFISDFDSKIKALYSCPYDGEEVERNCSNDADKMLAWAERQQRKSDKKEQD